MIKEYFTNFRFILNLKFGKKKSFRIRIPTFAAQIHLRKTSLPKFYWLEPVSIQKAGYYNLNLNMNSLHNY